MIAFNARAYIHLNRRNSKQISLEMMELLAHNIRCDQFNYLDKLYNSVCGHHHSTKDKTWIVDIDDNDLNNLVSIYNFIKHIEPIGDKLIAKIPTKNGFHLITKPFNSQKFSERYPKIDIHKNNPTLCYIP